MPHKHLHNWTMRVKQHDSEEQRGLVRQTRSLVVNNRIIKLVADERAVANTLFAFE